jgi:choline dehydrogenase-like flavoprotein
VNGLTCTCTSSPWPCRRRGPARLADARPGSTPIVDPDYLGEEHDLEVLRRGLAIARHLGEADALAGWRKSEAAPGPEVQGKALDDYLRATVVTYFHSIPAGTTNAAVYTIAERAAAIVTGG